MTGRRNGILMHRDRVISKTPTKMVVWLTSLNIYKMKQRGTMSIFFGEMEQAWINDGAYRLAKKMRNVKYDRGLKYYKCELVRVQG